MQLYDLDLFFSIFSTNNKLLIFAYGQFVFMSLRKFKALPDNTSFMYCGTEYTINNKLIKRV